MDEPGWRITRNPLPDGVDYVLERADDGEFPIRGEKLLLGIAVLVVLSMLASFVAVFSNALRAWGLVGGFPWLGVVAGVAVVVGVLGLQGWVFSLDDGEIRVALRMHHVTVGSERLALTDIDRVEATADGIALHTATRAVRIPVRDRDLLADLERAVAGAPPGSPPEALQALRNTHSQ
ncbi:MAG: hypothetical protein KC656_08635 [Myxococcales bacterium]|nr:hypothetical protein [Myxococcales bacterium]